MIKDLFGRLQKPVRLTPDQLYLLDLLALYEGRPVSEFMSKPSPFVLRRLIDKSLVEPIMSRKGPSIYRLTGLGRHVRSQATEGKHGKKVQPARTDRGGGAGDRHERASLSAPSPNEEATAGRGRLSHGQDASSAGDSPGIAGGCPHWPGCGCGTQSGPHSCEWRQA